MRDFVTGGGGALSALIRGPMSTLAAFSSGISITSPATTVMRATARRVRSYADCCLPRIARSARSGLEELGLRPITRVRLKITQ